MFASQNGHDVVIDKLLQHGAGVDLLNKAGRIFDVFLESPKCPFISYQDHVLPRQPATFVLQE